MQAGRHGFAVRLSRLPFKNLGALERRKLSRLSTMRRAVWQES
jgi:hypothetical protein